MRKTLSFIVFSVLAATIASPSHASPPPSRGARPIALGNAYTAVSGDGYGLFYNPAGLYDVAQQETIVDYGRWYSKTEPAGSDFNGIYAMPYRYRDQRVPIAVGVYGESPAPGAHIVDITGGGAMDAPMDTWTKGFIKFPVRIGAAVTLRHEHGDKKSDRVDKATFGLGGTVGALVPIDRDNQVGVALRNIYPLGGDNEGPSLHIGATRHHRDYLDLFFDMEVAQRNTWRFHPGMEWLLARGVLRPRLGYGFHDKGNTDVVSTGVGFYLSPYQVDIAYLIPVKTINDNAGEFRASLTYKFGRPQFSEVYYDRALEQASQLDNSVLQLTVKEAETKSSLSELEQKRRITAEELQNMKSRIEQLRGQDVLGERDATIRQLQARVRALEAERSERSRASRAPEPRTHVVQPGDTLQSIARKYYGDPNQWKKIYNANVDKIERGLPKQGSKLVIPN